ncbi:MAG: cupin domain-containing protein [SAR202 cluster bacterium]|nr:cupin domain-containing protein [SAR202 cluster bacterium]
MRVLRRVERQTVDQSDRPIFTGGRVTSNPLVGSDISRFFNFHMVNFGAGARNKFHVHTSDQVLYVTSGRGIIATEASQTEIAEGGTVFIPAGEKHWHGATSASDFSHISLTSVDATTTTLE